MERLDDLRSFPSPVFVVPEICRGNTCSVLCKQSQMVNSCYQTCQSESAWLKQLTQQHLGPGPLGPHSALGEEQLLARKDTAASTGKPTTCATARITQDHEFTTATSVAFNLGRSNLQVQAFQKLSDKEFTLCIVEVWCLCVFRQIYSSYLPSLRPQTTTS